MNTFTIFPAIDLRQGKVVRLKQGDLRRQTRYEMKPADAADRWIDAGARWLHVVNLDGAFGETSIQNLAALGAILHQADLAGVKVQFGGGIRNLEAIQTAVTLGVHRVILGTAAVHEDDLMRQAVDRFGSEAVAVGIDARDGVVRIQGWVEATSLTAVELGQKAAASGVSTLIFTNIARDGVSTGVDLEGTALLCRKTGLTVIASGGVAALADIQAVQGAGLGGVIVGRALYEGQIDLAEAIACCEGGG